MTVVVLMKLQRINAQIVLRERSQPWYEALRAAASRLARLLRDPDNARPQISEILVSCRPILRDLRRCLPFLSQKRRRVRILLRLMGRYLKGSSGGAAREIHLAMLEVNQALKEDIEQARLYQAKV